ncbi:MAG: DCC1-like thiol-disulfide oxidoreductase family protein, partial [Nevskiales bacterium]
DAPPLQLVYDGECPFCTRYVKLLRLRETVGELELISARSMHPLVAEVLQQGFVIDDGMVLKMQGRYYHGDDCLHVLAMMSSQRGWFNRINFWLFRSAWLSR